MVNPGSMIENVSLVRSDNMKMKTSDSVIKYIINTINLENNNSLLEYNHPLIIA